jgi:CMP-N-acetylneuraminic acid synthetase
MIAIILGRAGSKGVPGKNMAMLAGRPCAAWTIEHAKRSTSISHVVVSSDDPDLLDLARSMHAIAINRPPELASDRATIDDAARHALTAFDELALNELALNESGLATHIAILYANVPVRPPDLTDRAAALLRSTNCDSVQSYAPVGKYHPWWTARVDDAGRVTPWEGTILNHNVYRRQDLPPAHIPDGGIIALTRDALTLQIRTHDGPPPTGPHAFFGLDRRGIINPENAVIDIDTPTDLLVADAILSSRAHA